MAIKYETSRKILAISKVYQRGKTQIPSDIRKGLGLKDNDRLLWVLENGKYIIERA